MTDHTVTTLTAATVLDGSELFYGVQGGADTKVTGTQIATLGATLSGRTRLSADTDYYVDHDTGSDSNAGTVGAPWLTIQHANDYISASIDINSKTVTVHVADSVTTYAGATLGPFVGGGFLVLLGNNTTLGNVKIGNSTSKLGNTVGSLICEGGANGTTFWVSGFEFAPSAGPCLDFDGADKGTCVLGEPTFLVSTKNKFAGCQNAGPVLIGNIIDETIGTSVIDGNAIDAHTPSAFYSTVNEQPQTAFFYCPDFSITGTVTFSIGFASISIGTANFSGSFAGAGTVHGRKFYIGSAGTLLTDSVTTLPGDIPGINYGGALTLTGTAFPYDSYIGPIPTSKSLQTPSTGFSITIANNIGTLILTPAGTLATGTITMPANPIDQQTLTITSTKAVTALTVSPNSGQSVAGNPSTLSAGGAINAIYNYSNTTWYLSAGGGGLSIGGAVTSGTSGSVLFIDGSTNLAQDNSKFFWDDTNYILKLGSAGTNAALYLNALPAIYEVPNGSGNNWFEGNAGNFTLTGYQNFGTGDGCMSALTSGAQNTGLGAVSLTGLTTGSRNAAMGRAALYSVGAGDDNLGIGESAGWQITSGSRNVAIGRTSLGEIKTENDNLALGYHALGNAGKVGASAFNVGIGPEAGAVATTTNGSVFIGDTSGGLITSSFQDIFIGRITAANATGSTSRNVMIGGGAGYYWGGGDNNTIIGTWLANSSGASFSSVVALSTGNDLKLDYSYITNKVWSAQNLTTAQGLHVYNTLDSQDTPTNYERGVFDWNITSNVLAVGTQAGGSGSTRNLKFIIGGTNKLDFGITNAATWTSPVAVCVTPVAVGSLPAAGIQGRRHFVTDATVTTFASVVAGTGGNPVPVYDDGTNWRIG